MQRKVMGLAAFVLFYSLSVIPFAAQEKASKAGVVSGNVGLVDLEKKYMIVITKGGKLISFDFSGETKVTDASGKAKVDLKEINIGESASVTYRTDRDRSIATFVKVMGSRPGGCPEGRPCPDVEEKDKRDEKTKKSETKQKRPQ